jgi:bacteriocin biosynthesis cyclodehydratase domain-containing protein
VSQDEDRRDRSADHQRVGPSPGLLSWSPDTPAGAAGDRRYQLRSSVEPLDAESGTLFLVCTGGEDLVIRDPEPADRELIALLAAGERSEAELVTALSVSREALRSKLDSLDQAGVLSSSDPSAELDAIDSERYSRQLPYLADMGDARALQRRLRRARVVVLGCGGLGTWTVAALASAGVGHFTLVDHDSVELSNLNRQILYGTADLGRPKVEASARWLRSFDEGVEVDVRPMRVDAPDRLPGIVESADVVVLVADSPPYELGRWVNAACIEADVPFITAGQVPPIVKIGPIYAPGRTACFACHERALRRDNPLYDEYVLQVQSTPSRSATLGPASGIVGTMLAMELLHFLIGREPATLGAALVVDLRTLESRREKIARDPRCEACHDR